MPSGRDSDHGGAGRRALRSIRGSQPFNWFATELVRGISRAAGRPIEPAVKHLPRVGITRARLPNRCIARFWSDGDDWVPNQVFWRGWQGYEPELTPIFYRLAETAATVVDVGAHVGFYSILAAHANPQASVYAFEPLPSVHARLVRNVMLNKLGNIHPVQAAAGLRSGRAEFFHVDTDIPCSSSLARDFMALHHNDVHVTEVKVYALDDFVEDRQLSRVDLIKLDTETTEADVLDGARRTLSRDRPVVTCEVLETAETGRLAGVLHHLNYCSLLLTAQGPVEQPRPTPHPLWTNYVFAPTERVADVVGSVMAQ